MKERAPAFQFFPRQFAADDVVTAMDLDAIGAHILLMCAAAASPEQYRIRCRINAEPLPEGCRDDAAEHAIRTRLRNPSNEDWHRIKNQLLSGAWKLSTDGQWWEQDGLKRTFMKQKEFSENQQRRALERWRKEHPEAMPDECRTDAGSVPEGMPEGCSSSSSSSSKKEESHSSRDEFTELEYARKFWEEMSVPFTSSTLTTAAQAIKIVAEKEHCSMQVAGERILERAQVARKAGKKVNSFWFTDGSHLGPVQTSGVQPVSEQQSLAARNRRKPE